MSDTALKARGIEDADTGVLLVAIMPRTGRVDLNVLAGTQPLGRPEYLHALKLLVERGLSVWPDLSETVATVVDKAHGHADRSEAQP